MAIIRISQHKTGIENYLENGKKRGRSLHRNELDVRVPLLGDLNAFKATNDYVQNNKKWNANYWHITISLPWKYHKVPQGVLREITHEVLDFYFHLYKRDQVAAYAEIHYPKQQTTKNKKTEKQTQRLPHVHLVVSKIDLWSGNQLRILPYKKEVAQAFQIWLDDNHSFDSHYKSNETGEPLLPSPKEAGLIVEQYKHWHRQYNQPNLDKQTYAPKIFLKRPDWLQIREQDENQKSRIREVMSGSDLALKIWRYNFAQEVPSNVIYSSVQALKRRLVDMDMLNEYKLVIEFFNKCVSLECVLDEAQVEFGLDRNAFKIIRIKGIEVAQDKRTGQSYSSVGIAHEQLNMSVIRSLEWLKKISPEVDMKNDFEWDNGEALSYKC